MATLVRVWTTRHVGPDGRRCKPGTPGARPVRKRSRKWYAQGPPLGKNERVPLCQDRKAAEAMLRKLVEQRERGTAGVPDASLRSRPLSEWATDWEAAIRIGGASVEYASERSRVAKRLAEWGFRTAAELSPDAVARRLVERCERAGDAPVLPPGEWFHPRDVAAVTGRKSATIVEFARRHGLAIEGRGPARRMPRATAQAFLDAASRGVGATTLKHHAAALRQFGRWLAHPSRLGHDPLAGLRAEVRRQELRRARRALSAEELGRLLAAALASPIVWRGLSGGDRRMLYLTAMTTGFRREELSALAPGDFQLDAEPPVAVLSGRFTKNSKPASQPLPPDLAAELRAYIAGKPPGELLWPMRALASIVQALRRDLADAGIPYTVPSPDGPLHADFHSLRHSYVLLLDAGGATLKQMQALMRHGDVRLTLERYGRPQLRDVAPAVAGMVVPTAGGVADVDDGASREQWRDLACLLWEVLLAVVGCTDGCTRETPADARPCPAVPPGGGSPKTKKARRAKGNSRGGPEKKDKGAGGS